MGFTWDAASFVGADHRFGALAEHADLAGTYVADDVCDLKSGGLLDLIMFMHEKLADQVFASTLCVPDMYRFLAKAVRDTKTLYDKSEHDATLDVDSAWKDGLEQPHGTANPDLEKRAPGGRGQFGTGTPTLPYPTDDGYPITEVVNRIVDLNLVPDGPPKSALGRVVWNYIWDEVGIGEIVDTFAPTLVGDWQAWQMAGSVLRNTGDYWRAYAGLGREDAGTFFLGWDGGASDQAETLFEAIFVLLEAAAPHVRAAGDSYAAHAYGVYLLTDEINSFMFDLVDQLRLLVGVLDSVAATTVAELFAHVVEIAERISETVAKIIGRVLLVARLLRALVAVIALIVGEFGKYKNEMWGYRLA